MLVPEDLSAQARSPNVTPVIGIVGVGRMGLPMCGRLVDAGYEVIAGDARGECEELVRGVGGKWVGNPAEVASDADVLITVLPGAAELLAAIDVAIPAMRSGTTWIDMTSCSPVIGGKLAARARERGVECLDVPVGGGAPAASSGALQLFVGGPKELLDRHRQMLNVLGPVVHLGDHGAGYVTKLLVNLLWFGQAVATGEALLLARRSGIDLDAIASAVDGSTAANEFLRTNLSKLLEGDYLPSFGLDRCCEELDAVVSLAKQLAVPFELSTQVFQAYARALDRYGPVDGELLAVALLEERAGTRLRG